MKTPEVGDSVVLPHGGIGSIEARIIRVDAVRRQVVASMLVSDEDTPFHLTFDDVSRLDSAPARGPDPS
ncbi:MAG TPA: hypothetical protein VGO52_26435 [Hyphomonadaceae bacterium]|jgi:transcription antitermination factor NusG|nr:hypothetical protein [Hyphomonadaceae bacterium]